MAEQVSSLIVRLIDQVTGPAKAVGRAIAGIGKSAKGASGITMTDRLDAAQARLSKRMSGYRMQMVDAMAMTYAFARAMKRPIDAAREFESQLTELGNKSGASKEQLAAFGKAAVETGKQTNQFTADLLNGADILVGAGMDFATAAKSIETIGKAATATGASIDDLSKLTNATIANLKVPVEQLELAFDKLAQAGKMGGFELRDMAQYFPDLGAAYATFGGEGIAAVTDLGSALQIVRRSTGDASQAANAVANLLQKARAPLTVKKFEDYGIDIRKALEKGMTEGKTPFDVMVEQTRKAQSKGALLEDLFSDKQVLEAMRPLLQFYDDFVKLREEAGKAEGVVLQDFFSKMETNAERTKAFQITLDNLALSIGNALLPALTSVMEKITPIVDAIAKWAEENPRLVAAIVGLTAGLLAFNIASIGVKYAAGFAYGGFLMLAKGVASVSLAFKTLAGAIAMTGIGAIVIGIAMAGIWIYNNWKGIAAMFDEFGRAFKEALGPEATAALETVIGWISDLWTWVTDLLGPINQTEEGWRAWGRTAGEALGGIVNWFTTIDEKLAALPGLIQENMRGIADSIRTSMEEGLAVITGLAEQWKAAGMAIVQALWDGMVALFDQLIAWVANKAAELTAPITGAINTVSGWFGGGEAAPASDGQKASGGPVARGNSYLVGERGPEIFRPATSGTIIPNKALGGGGGTTISPTFNIAINGNADATTVENIRRVLRDEVRQAFRGVYADAGLRFA
jgi:TP901 family phage tail tape measure protein